VVNITKQVRKSEANSATALDVNPDTADARSARRRLERNDIAATRGEVDREGRIDTPKVGEVTVGGQERRKGNGTEGKTHLCVVIHVGALLMGGEIDGCMRRGVRRGEIAEEGSMRGGSGVVGAIFLDDELALGKCPFQEGIIRRRA
jgi:hypothetical protein